VAQGKRFIGLRRVADVEPGITHNVD